MVEDSLEVPALALQVAHERADAAIPIDDEAARQKAEGGEPAGEQALRDPPAVDGDKQLRALLLVTGAQLLNRAAQGLEQRLALAGSDRRDCLLRTTALHEHNLLIAGLLRPAPNTGGQLCHWSNEGGIGARCELGNLGEVRGQ